MNIYLLEPIYDSRASFYGKARVLTDDISIKLISYNTIVAEVKEGQAIIYGNFSNTATRHQKEFLKQRGFEANSIKQTLNDYGVIKK